MNELQYKLYDMFKWFDVFCKENDISYYAVGGTLLGACRHKGFIPWDDDIDIALPRPDYEKLILLLDKQQDNYFLETPFQNNKDYLYSYSKLYDVTTTLVENTRYQCKRGVYIDIFPLDGIGNDMSESIKNFSRFDKLNMFLMTRTCAIRKERSIYKNIAIFIARLIPNFFIDDKKLSIKVDSLASKYKYDKCNYVANLMGAYRSKEIIPKEFLGNPTLYKFEDIYVYGPEKYEEYLTHMYGDWRQLPPKEKQHSHHDYIELDFDTSYILDSAK